MDETTKKQSAPDIATLCKQIKDNGGGYYNRSLGKQLTEEQIEEDNNNREMIADLVQKTLDSGVKIVSLRIGTDGLEVGVGVGHDLRFGVSYTNSYRHQHGEYSIRGSASYFCKGTAFRVLKIAKALGDNLRHLSSKSLTKWLKGEVRMDDEEYLNLVTVQSMQNRCKE